ncbi:hypothetical protein PC121_g21942 [Phytophthora cactorum]|nr:hypothetical protein PC121_g21942 [Phytophthora cactorum]
MQRIARRREQCRINQARYRRRKEQRAQAIHKAVLKLREEISQLELQQSHLLSSVKHSVFDVVVEYFLLFRHGLTSLPVSGQTNFVQDPQVQQKIKFLHSSMASDVCLGQRHGVDVLSEQWYWYSSCFEELYLQLEHIEKVAANLVVVSASLAVKETETILKCVFPHLMENDQDLKPTASGGNTGRCSFGVKPRDVHSSQRLLKKPADFYDTECMPLVDIHVNPVVGDEMGRGAKSWTIELKSEKSLCMTARRKRSALSRASKRAKSKSVVVEEHKTIEGQNDVIMETYRFITAKQVWKLKRPCYKLQDQNDLKAIIPMQTMLSPMHSYLPQFQSADQLAEWVFDVAKYRPMKLNLNCNERSEEVRDALLRQFHRWPGRKISEVTERCQKRTQEAEQQCLEQVQLYLQNLRGMLLAGATALFWLELFQPLLHPASVPRPEARDVLMAFLDELKSVDGFYEHLMEKNGRLWAVLTLPLKLEPLFRGVSALALCGHQIAANEAMQLLAMFAGEYTALAGHEKRKLPVGLSVVASVGIFSPLDLSGLIELPKVFREQLSEPLVMMVRDWIGGVNEVLDLLEKTLTCKWTSCERAPFEEELKMTMQSELQSAFERLSHALAADQLYAMRKVAGERSNIDMDCLNVNVVSERGLLFVTSG